MSQDEFLFDNDLISIASLINARLKYTNGNVEGNQQAEDNNTKGYGEVRGVDFL